MVETVITTFGGTKTNYLKPKKIDLADIALGLSRQPRYAGQTNRFYSVAQHCLLVARLCPRFRAYALIHDAQEALLADIPTPAKLAMRELSGGRSAYDELESRLYYAICEHVGLEPRHPIMVHVADVEARKIEAVSYRRERPGKTPYDDIFNLPDGGKAEWLSAVKAIKKGNS